MRTRVFVKPTHLEHTHEAEDPDAFHAVGYDNSFSMEKFKRNLKIKIIELTHDTIVFDLIGVGAPIANALRRILLSDVPTMAIEKVILFQNTSIIQDEVLAHRLGLVPIYADPSKFEYLHENDDIPTEHNTTVFTLEVACTPGPNSALGEYKNGSVYSSQLQWIPQGSQAERFKDDPIRPVYDDIVIAKLRPGQSIEAELHVVKGIGRDHAKWSPVSTAFYRQMPDITFNEPFLGEEAKQLAELCPMGVFDIEDMGNGPQAVVGDARSCTMCRECIRDPKHEKRINLRRVRDHFIFTIESVGAIPPEELFRRAIAELKNKVAVIADALDTNNANVPKHIEIAWEQDQ